MSEQMIDDLCSMFNKDVRADVRLTASNQILSLTGSSEGRLFIRQNKKLLELILSNIAETGRIQLDAVLELVNLTADEPLCEILIKQYDVIETFVKNVTNAKSVHADKFCSLLSNLTRNSRHAALVFEKIQTEGLNLLFGIYLKISYNSVGNTLDYLGQVLANLTQVPNGRMFFLDKEKLNIQKLLPFLSHESIVRRGAAAILVKNICFVSDDNNWLLGPSVDILPALMLPLAGGPEVANLDMDDMDKLPDDLQFLEETKQREEDDDIRKMLVEAIHLLCNKKEDRQFIREKNTYVILRELHKFEMTLEAESENNRAIQQLIDLLIGDDPDVSELSKVEVPEELKEKLEQTDKEELERIEKYKRGELEEEDAAGVVMMK